MIQNILILTLNDLAIALKNKTIYLILFIPFFVFLSLQLVDQEGAGLQQVKIGLVKDQAYPTTIIEKIQASDKLFSIFWLNDQAEGKKRLKEKKLDGILLASAEAAPGLKLIVLKKTSHATIAIVESLSALQTAVEGKSKNWIADIQSLQDSGVQRQTLPTWILMLVLLVGFIIIPAQVAEEKEKKLLLGLLQTPINEFEWLLAKLLLGMILIHLAVIFLHLLGGFEVTNILSYWAFISAGSFCFSSFGIFLGFLCRSQASARSLGVFFYLPLLLPSALSDFSEKLTNFAPLLPSYQFYQPIKAILLEGSAISDFPLDLLYLIFVGILTSLLSYQLIKKRWLM